MTVSGCQRRQVAWLAVIATAVGCAEQLQAAGFYRAQWAVLVGVSQYASSGIPRLRFCHRDVADLKQALIEHCGFAPDHIVTLTNGQATREAIMSALTDLTSQQRVAEQDGVLIFFSGHGQTVSLPRGGEMGFLLPHDAKVSLENATDPTPFYRTCIGMDELRRLSDLVPAKHVLFLVDACYSGLAVASSRGINARNPLSTVARRPVREIIVAGLRDEQAAESEKWGHGAFTYSLLQGLKTGSCDVDRDGAVTGMELALYLRQTVPRIARQTPQFATFSGDGEFILTTKQDKTAKHDAGGGIAPSLQLTSPSDLGDDAREVLAPPFGGEAAIEGCVLDDRDGITLTLNGKPVPLSPVATRPGLAMAREADKFFATFRASVPVAAGQTVAVTLVARDADGQETRRRLSCRAVAPDTTPPEVCATALRTLDATGKEVDWRGLAVASRGLITGSKGLTITSKGIAVVPRAEHTVHLLGYARDDQTVASVTVNQQTAMTRRATADELTGLGWQTGVAFEISLHGELGDVIRVNATDSAGNVGQCLVQLEVSPAGAPEIVVLEPPPLGQSRGLALVTPKSVGVTVRGLARSEAGIAAVEVGSTPAKLRPATADEVKRVSWSPPVTLFEALLPAKPTTASRTITITATDRRGRRASTSLTLRAPQAPLRAAVTTDRPIFRFGQRIHFNIRVNRDAYVYLFHLESDRSLTLLLPNIVEQDTLVNGEIPRRFPDPVEEERWPGQYALEAVAPAGRDTVYALVLLEALPRAHLDNLNSWRALQLTLESLARRRGARLKLPSSVDERAIRSAAEQLGGTLLTVHYDVRR